MISFNVPPSIGNEIEFIREAIENKKISGDGEFTKKCTEILTKITNANKLLLTTSCTHALEMAAILSEIIEKKSQKSALRDDRNEVIMPSFTFVSTANAFVLQNMRIVFVDIRPDTMNIDENLIEKAITKRTRAIVPVHYAGVGCEMDKINDISDKYNLTVIEDAAQGLMSYYKDKPLGSIGDFGCYSFHETKNYSMGEGGAIAIKNKDMSEYAEIIREKGTNRSKFFRGEIDKYTWINYGSSYLPSELNVAYLYAQIQNPEIINNDRLASWNYYFENLSELKVDGKIELPFIPKHCRHNGHMFYIKAKDLLERTELINYLKQNGVNAVFHYVPLHSAPAGRKFGKFNGKDIYTTKESERLLRLPMYYGLTRNEQDKVIKTIKEFYAKNRISLWNEKVTSGT